MRFTANHKLAILLVLIAIPTAFMAWKKTHEVDDEELLQRFADTQTRLEKLKAEQAQQAAMLDDQQAKQRASRLRELFSTDHVGGLGELFDPFQLDPPWSADADLRGRIDRFGADTGATVSIAADEITVTLPNPQGKYSEALRDAANDAWRPADQDRWLDDRDHLRASIKTSFDGAELRWERAIDVTELFPYDPAVPSILYPTFDGPTAVTPELGTTLSNNADGFTYSLPAIGWSHDKVVVQVTVVGHAITTIHIETGAMTDAEIAVVDGALRDRYGEPSARGDWRAGKVTITRTMTTGGLVVDLKRGR
jgi:hypothetical protein